MARNVIHEIDFTYLAQVRPPRARNVRQIMVLDRLPVSFRELSDDEFPLVARVTDVESIVKFGGESVDVRGDGRRLYRRWADESIDNSQKRATWTRLPLASGELAGRLAAHDEQAQSPLRHIQRVPAAHWANQATRKADLVGEVQSDDRRDRVAAILDTAARTVTHGGYVWTACGEPCWKVEQGREPQPTFATSSDIERAPWTLWRADRLEDCAQLTNRRRAFREVFGSIEVMRPDMLHLAPEATSLLLRASDAVSGLVDGLRTATRAQFDAYATLRDALAEGASNGKREVTEELAGAIRAVIEDPESGLEEWHRVRLTLAFERWRLAIICERPGAPGADAPAPR